MRLSYEQLELISDAVPALISYVDREYRYRMCNLAYTAWFGLSREEVVGHPMSEIIGEPTWRAIRPHLEAAFAGETREFETEAAYRHGDPRWIHGSYTPQRDDAGRVAGVVVLINDITARKQAETKLRASEERYRSLFNSIDEGFCVIEPLFDAQLRPIDYRFHEVNPAFEQQSGLRDVIGRRMLEFVSHIEPHWLENYGRVALTGEPIRFSAEYRSLDRWFDVYAFRIGDSAGRRVAVLFNDISERKISDDALRESEARFRNMSDHSPLMLWVTDAAGRCTHLNERWLDFTGQAPADGLGYGWLDAVHPDDRPGVEKKFFAANAARQPLRLEFRLAHRSGHHRWVLAAAAPRLSAGGDFLGYIGSLIDIQDRKEMEEALRQHRERFDIVKDAAHVGFWFCDLPFNVLEWDNRVKDHFWLPPEAPVTIDTFYERIHSDDRAPVRAAVAQSIAEKTRYDVEYRTIDSATHAEKWIRAIGRAFYDEAGVPVRFDGVTLDVTERKRDEDALREAKERAERASRAKDDFLAQLSHELRTPLTPVLMTATALGEDDRLPSYARAQLEMISRNIALEARLIDDLLDLTRITHGKLALRPERCDVHSLLHLVFEIIREEAREKRIDLALDLAATRTQLDADPARLQQVFWNLLRNAVKFTPEGGHVRLRTSDRACSDPPAPGDRICIEVTDDGIGFDPVAAERLFQPFERGLVAHDQRFPGLGLGLAIARAIVDLHGGTIRSESAGPGRGATFTVELLGARRPAVPVPRPTHGHAAAPDRIPPLRLLLVEDHAPTLDVLSRLLRRDGHQIKSASNIAEALAAAAHEKFDAVMSDLGLPDGTGIELMEKLRERHALRGIALSGYGMDEDLRRTAAAGFVAHLIKPVDMKEVRRALRQFSTTVGDSAVSEQPPETIAPLHSPAP